MIGESSLEEVLLGMASQLAEKEDTTLCSDVRDRLFGPNEFSRRDLGALNIMRGRDHGIPDYNTVSQHYISLQFCVNSMYTTHGYFAYSR